MALVEINRDPSQRQLKWFGGLFGLFFGLIGGMAWWRYQSPNVASIIWAIAVSVVVIFYAYPPLQKPLYLSWTYLTFPIGWAFSHLLLALTYYLIFTPIGLAMRLFGRDPMQRRFEPDTDTYWVKHNPGGDAARYFRQF